MKSRTTARFRKALGELPGPIQQRARKAYALFRSDPMHPGLRFKRVRSSDSVVSVRITLGYRALGVVSGDAVVWFWIGSHEDYDRLLKQL